MSYQSTPSNSTPDGTPRLRLFDQVRETIRRKYYSRRTGEAYVHWIKRFINFIDNRHPAPGAPEVTTSLGDLVMRYPLCCCN